MDKELVPVASNDPPPLLLRRPIRHSNSSIDVMVNIMRCLEAPVLTSVKDHQRRLPLDRSQSLRPTSFIRSRSLAEFYLTRSGSLPSITSKSSQLDTTNDLESHNRHWQCIKSTPLERLHFLLQSGVLSDVTFMFPNDNDKVLHAHRLILAMSSEVFHIMLYGSLAEGDIVRLPEDSYEGFQWLLEYMYNGSTFFKNLQMACQVYYLSHKYQMDSVSKLCSDYILAEVCPQTVLDIYQLSVFMENRELISRCTLLINETGNELFSSPSSDDLSHNFIIYLLKSDGIVVTSESVIAEFLIRWAKHQLFLRHMKESKIAIRNEIIDFIPYLRFLSMSLSEFLETIVPTQILTSEQSLDVLLSINRPTAPLPEDLICSKLGPRMKRSAALSFSICKISNSKHSNLMKPVEHYGTPDLFLRVSKTIVVNEIIVDISCYAGDWFLSINNKDGILTGISSQGPPWIFSDMQLEPKHEYKIKFIGTGSMHKHVVKIFNQTHNGIQFSGQCSDCIVWIKYLTIY